MKYKCVQLFYWNTAMPTHFIACGSTCPSEWLFSYNKIMSYKAEKIYYLTLTDPIENLMCELNWT